MNDNINAYLMLKTTAEADNLCIHAQYHYRYVQLATWIVVPVIIVVSLILLVSEQLIAMINAVEHAKHGTEQIK